MFYFMHRTRKGNRRDSHDIAVGDWVESRYRAHWQGEVVALEQCGGLAQVRQVLSKRGVPLHRSKVVRRHCCWFTKVPKPT